MSHLLGKQLSVLLAVHHLDWDLARAVLVLVRVYRTVRLVPALKVIQLAGALLHRAGTSHVDLTLGVTEVVLLHFVLLLLLRVQV